MPKNVICSSAAALLSGFKESLCRTSMYLSSATREVIEAGSDQCTPVLRLQTVLEEGRVGGRGNCLTSLHYVKQRKGSEGIM